MYFLAILSSITHSEGLLQRCETVGFNHCDSCTQDNYLVEGICLAYCPSEYYSSSTSCLPTFKSLFTLDLSSFNLLKATRIHEFSSPSSSSFDSKDQDSPLLTMDRGFYFKKSSSLEALSAWTPGPILTLSIWIKLLDPGEFLSISNMLKLSFDETRVNSYVMTKKGKMIEASTSYSLGKWTHAMIIIRQTINYARAEVMSNGDEYNICEGCEIVYGKNEDWVIGGFQGFLYYFEAANGEIECIDVGEIVECLALEYFDGEVCKRCDSSCSDWPWCVDETCDICENPPCDAYSKKTSLRQLQVCKSGCNTCTGSYIQDCISCNSPYILIEGICVTKCPNAYQQPGPSCSSTPSTSTCILSLNFQGIISSSITDSCSSITVAASGTSYPAYNNIGPYATNQRGYYFTGNSFLSFTDTYTFVLAPKFAIIAWVYTEINSFVLFSKIYLGANDIIAFGADSSLLYLKLFTTMVTSSLTVSQSAWHYIGVQTTYSGDYLSVRYYVDTSAETVASSMPDEWLDDLYDPYSVYISGKGSSPTDGYKGFLTEISVYNSNTFDISSSITIPSYPVCSIVGYLDGSSCSSCSISCSYGCVNADISCNLCFSTHCSDCNNFVDSCSSCKAVYYSVQGCCTTLCPSGFDGAGCTQTNEWVFNLDLMNVIKDVVTDTKSSIQVSTGDDTSFYPNYASTDPIAAKDRGYYFTGSSYMKLPDNSLILAPEHTILIWAKPLSSLCTLFSKQNLADSLIYSLSIASGYIKSSYFASEFIASNTVTSGSWNFIAVQYSISLTFIYSVQIFTNSASEIKTALSPGWFDDSSSNFKITIGSKAPIPLDAFSGFLWSISIYNSKSPILTNIYSTTTLPSTCAINQYPDGGATCTNCYASHALGCVRNDIKFNLCYDQQCATCDNFDTSCITCITNASGSPCDCSAGFFWNSVTETCDACTTNCAACNNGNLDQCTYCSAGYYLVTSVCVSDCPTGYTPNSVTRVCDLNDALIFELTMNNIEDIISETASGFQVTTGTDNSFYPTYAASDPYAARYRGYYFNGNSYMQGPPNTQDTSTVKIAPQFTISAWIRPAGTAGDIITIQDASDNKLISLSLISGSLSGSIKLTSTHSLSATISTNGWNYIALSGILTSTPSYRIKLYVNNTLTTSSDLEVSFYSPLSPNYFTIASSRSGSSFTNYFTGFIYEIRIYNIAQDPALIVSTSCSGCTICPTSPQCLYNCPINYYWTGTACSICKATCASIGCVRFDTSCNLCNDVLCSVCSGYTSLCTTCKSGTINTAGVCSCSPGYSYDTISESCLPCTTGCSLCTSPNPVSCSSCLTNFYLHNNACLSYCPTGFSISGSNCIVDGSAGYIFSIFPNKIEDTITDTEKGFKVTTGANTNFYPTYHTSDPLASPRGYYFTGTSYMSLPPNYQDSNPSITFSPVFTVSTWIRYVNSGTILIKQGSSSPYTATMHIFLAGSNPTISLLLTGTSTSIGSLSCSTTIDSTSWHQVAYKITLSSGTHVTCIIDGTSEGSVLIGTYLLIDTTSSFKITIGANSGASFSNYFTGFLYSMKIWNLNADPISQDTGSCGSCTTCPPTGCIPNCAIDQYWSGSSCLSCNSNCAAVGCVRNDIKCNLCASQLCNKCSDYTTCGTTSADCITNTDPNPCTCVSGTYFDLVLEACTTCPSACSTCTSSALVSCTACTGSTYAVFGLCRNFCPSGYVINANNCDASASTLILQLTFDKISGTVNDASPLSAVATTGSTSAFYPTYDANDPIASKYRGYYFNGATSVINLPPFTSYTTPIIYIAPKVTVDAWIFPTSGSGTIISKQEITNFDGVITLKLSSGSLQLLAHYDSLGIVTHTCPLALTLNTWNYIGYTIDYSAPDSLAQCYINNSPSTILTLGAGFIDDAVSSYKLIIGASFATGSTFTSYFTGFIYSISIDNSALSPSRSATTCSGGCALCLSTGNCLVSCQFNQYWQGGSYNNCGNCNGNCLISGCIDAGASCTLCADIRCKSCTDYTAGTCTACKPNASNTANCQCNSGFYWNPVTETCDSCHPTCGTCAVYGFMTCLTCKPGYVSLNSACHPYCPTGYNSNGSGGCTLVNSPSFKISPLKLEGTVVDTAGAISVITGLTSTFYPTLEASDPIPVKDRGYYFSGASRMSLPPTAEFPSPVYTFGNTFMISSWLMHQTDGLLFSNQNNAYVDSLKITISTQPIISLILQDSGTVYSYTCSSTLSSYWNFVAFKLKLLPNGDTQIECTINAVTDPPTILTNGYFIGSASFFTIGARATSASAYTSFWTGYLYSLAFYNDYTGITETTATCTPITNQLPCAICPSSTSSCINQCSHNTYWDGVTCSACDPACSSCVRNDFVCNLCYDEICYKCSDYSSGICTQCKPNANKDPVTNICTCFTYYYWDTVTKSCNNCHARCYACTGTNYLHCTSCISGYYWFYDLCLSSCPSGYTANAATANCDMNYQQVLNLNFDTMSGQVADTSSSTISTQSGSTTNFYPAYDSDDPYASYMRGYYFHGGAKVFLPPYPGNTLPLLILAPDLTFNMWLRPSADGSIINHQLNAVGVTLYLGINILALKAVLNIRLANSGVVSVDSSTALTLNAWSHVGFTVKVTQAVGTQITSYLDMVQKKQLSYSLDYFNAPYSNFLWIIGASYSTTTTFGSFFTGYIYSLTLWNAVIPTASWNLANLCTANPTSCTVCPVLAGTCLPDCNLNQYYDPVTKTCGSCKVQCTSGCRDATYCNLCYDPVCSYCSTFISGSCTTCKANSDPLASGCTCRNLYIWYEINEVCSMCYTGCSNCLTPVHNQCTMCSVGYYLTYSECLNFCPFGFTADSVNRICTAPASIYVFQIDMGNIIYGQVIDSKNSFPVLAGSSLTFYPLYDSIDPMAADSRGYYFSGSSSMNIQSSPTGLLNFPSRLTIGLWVNYMADGTLIAKQSILNPTKKLIEFNLASNKLFVNMLLTTGQFSATSVMTVSQNVWHYLSYQLNVLLDGSSTITFMVDTSYDTPIILAIDYFIDLSTSFTFLIGAEYTGATQGNYFKGYIWRVSMWQDLVSNFAAEISSTCTGCSFCPISPTCLSLCTPTQLVPSCVPCPVCATQTCVSITTCNLCNDLKCYICIDYTATGCTQCVVNAGFTSGVGSACQCNAGYSWNSVTEACVLCANLCAPCFNLQTTGCSACIPNTYFHDLVCMPYCPTGFTPGTTTCSGTSGLIFKISLLEIKGTVTDLITAKIKLITGTSNVFYPAYEANDPYAAQYRGYYFDGISAYMSFVSNANNNMQLVISPIHTIGMWIYPLANAAALLSKKTSALVDYLIFEIDSSGYLKLTILLKLIQTAYTYTSPQSAILNTWNHIGYNVNVNSANNYELIMYLNGVADPVYTIAAGHYEDLTSSYLFSLGANYLTSSTFSNYFKGYINEVKVWSMKYDLSLEIGTCATCKCPSSTNVCLSTCSLNQYQVNGVCFNCLGSCTTSCVRGSDCNLCYEILCSSCQDFSATGCTGCKPNASLAPSSNACSCNLGTYYDASTISCLSCFSYCSGCTSGKNGDCSSCAALSYLNPEAGLCLTSCPAGYKAVGNLCSAIATNTLVALFKFTKLTNVMYDSNGVYPAYMGSTNNFFGNFDVNDPYPEYSRGLYFTGSSYVSLPPNSANVTSVILGNTHTVSMWIRPQSHTSNHYVMSKEDGSAIRAALYIDKTTLQLKAIYRVYSDTSNTANVINALGPTVSAWDTWCEISVTLVRSGYTTEVTLYLNGVSGAVSSIPNTFFHDVTSNTFRLGYSQVSSAYMKGFIYEIRIYNFIKAIAAPSNTCGCGGCTSDGICLTNCGYLQYFDSICKNCLAACTTGCINGNNCKMNLDPLCNTATGFTTSECTSCIVLSSGAGNGCQCMANSIYDSASSQCNCISGYTLFSSECVPCYYPLQSSDISGYFSQDYTQIIFNSTIAAKSTTTSDCKQLFELSSYAMLGISASCKWSSNMMVLTVTLGVNATVVQSPLTFIAQVLYSDTVICGVSPNSVTINIAFKYTRPNIVPVAWLLAPLQSYILCDDLTLDGSKSSNGFNRPLQYQWIFVSNPKVPALLGYEEFNISNYKLYFPRSSLVASNVVVTMTVSNWLGFTASVTQSIQIIQGQGLHLVLDGDTKWIMTTQDSKTIFIQATSSCSYSASLSYAWAITSQVGNFSGYDSTALWKSQTTLSRIYIPPNVLKPGYYTFQVNVTDNVKAMSGSTQFGITIVTQSLVIKLPATYFTVNSKAKVTISADESYDPDKLLGIIAYNWTCTQNSQSCDSLIFDSSASTLTINTGLIDGATYLINLTISKDLRSTSQILTIKAVSFAVPSVTFSLKSGYVNSQLPVSIVATIIGAGDFTYTWSVETGGAYTFSTPVNSLQIGFKANSLAQGSSYVLRFEVLSSGNVAVYKLGFSVIKQPIGGSLQISPSMGTEQTTLFLLTAAGWIDGSSPDTGILTFQFGYNLNNEAIILNIRNQSSFLYCNLPYSQQPLVVWVKVINSIGGYSLSTTTVTMIKNKADLSSMALTSLSADLSNDLSDPAVLPQLIASVSLYYFTNTSISSTNKDQVYSQVLSAVNKVIATTTSIQNQDIENLLSILSVVTTNYKPISADGTIQELYAILSLSQSAALTMDVTQLSYYTNIIQQATGFATNLIYKNITTVTQTNNFLKNALATAATKMVNGQTISYSSSQIYLSATLFSNTNFTNFTSPVIPGFLGSISLSNLTISSLNPLLSVLIIYDDKKTSLESNKSLPTGLDYSILEIKPSSNSTLALELKTPMNISLPLYNYTNGTIQCVYMNGNWSAYGLSMVSYSSNTVTCTSNHTSLFSAGVDLVPYIPPPIEPPAPHTVDKTISLFMFYYMCGLLGIWIILSSILLIIDNSEIIERKKAETLANDRFAKWYRTEEVVEKIASEKKTNETQSVDQNPAFFRKTRKDTEKLPGTPFELNPFLKSSFDGLDNSQPPGVLNLGNLVGEKQEGEPTDEKYLLPSKNPFSLNYFISFLIFYEPYYTRFTRCLALFTALAIENCVIGAGIYIAKDSLNVPDNLSISDGFHHLGYLNLLTGFVIALVINIIAFALQQIMKSRVLIYQPGSDGGKIKARARIWRVIGIILCLVIIGFTIFACYFFSNSVYTPQSIIWLYMVFVSMIFDMVAIQNFKSLSRFIRNRRSPRIAIVTETEPRPN